MSISGCLGRGEQESKMRRSLTFHCVFPTQLKKIPQVCITLSDSRNKWEKKSSHGKGIGQDSTLLKYF